MAKVTIQIGLTIPEHEALEKEARAMSLSVPQYIRFRIIQPFLEPVKRKRQVKK